MTKTLKQDFVNAICQQFLPLVKKYARRYRYIEDPEQEAWLILVQAIKDYDSKKGVPLAGYLESKVNFGMFNLCRSWRSRQQENIGDLDRVPSSDDLETLIERKLIIKDIQQKIHQLPQKQRYVIIQNIVNQYKLNHIASDMRISTSAVYQLKKRALARLKKAQF